MLCTFIQVPQHLHRFLIGNNNYFSKAVTPSLYDFWSGLSYSDYYSEPQEYIADILGNVTRIDNNIPYQYNITNMEAVMYFIYSIKGEIMKKTIIVAIITPNGFVLRR